MSVGSGVGWTRRHRRRRRVDQDEDATSPAGAGEARAGNPGRGAGGVDQRVQFGRADGIVVAGAGVGRLELRADLVDVAGLQRGKGMQDAVVLVPHVATAGSHPQPVGGDEAGNVVHGQPGGEVRRRR